MWFQEVDSNGTITLQVLPDGQYPEDRWQVATMVGPMRVSTVFLGLMHSGGIYETMVFEDGGSSEVDFARYHTRAEAIEGHARIVRKWAELYEARVDRLI